MLTTSRPPNRYRCLISIACVACRQTFPLLLFFRFPDPPPLLLLLLPLLLLVACLFLVPFPSLLVPLHISFLWAACLEPHLYWIGCLRLIRTRPRRSLRF